MGDIREGSGAGCAVSSAGDTGSLSRAGSAGLDAATVGVRL